MDKDTLIQELQKEIEQLKAIIKYADERINHLVKELEQCRADAGKKRHTLYK